MTTRTHEEVSELAKEIWQKHGCPAGRDTEIWLEAERTLNEASPSCREDEVQPSTARPKQKSMQKSARRDAAQAPQVAHHSEPRKPPAATGKPLWPQAQSS